MSPASLSFGNITTGSSSAAQSAIITNTGNSNVVISQISLSGAGYTMTGGSAPVTLTPLQTASLSVQFSPTAAGAVSGNVSIVSNATGSPATVPLTGTGVAPVQHSVALTWNASTSTVAGYNVYRGTVSGGPYAKINSSLVVVLDYTDSNVQSGTTYYYVTTAVNSSGNESVFSNEVSGTIP
jgi:fibronectin type 3 domain-containing protein